MVGNLTASQESDHLVAKAVRMRKQLVALLFKDEASEIESTNQLLIRSVRFTQVEPRVRVRHPVD